MKTIVKRLLLIILLVAAAAGTALYIRYVNSRGESAYEDYTKRIDQLISSENYENALSLCDEAIEKFSGRAQLYIYKSEAYAALGNESKARGTLSFGYKQTKSEAILRLLEKYPSDNENDVEFMPPVPYEFGSEKGGEEGGGVTVSSELIPSNTETPKDLDYSLPEVDIPDVTTDASITEDITASDSDTEDTAAVSDTQGDVSSISEEQSADDEITAAETEAVTETETGTENWSEFIFGFEQ